MDDYFVAHQQMKQKINEIINGRPLYEKDIDMIVDRVLQKLSVSVDVSKAIENIESLNSAIKKLGGK